ncbi:MAG: thioesterase domain-containing protein [Cyanobacteria bacterium J06639_18]
MVHLSPNNNWIAYAKANPEVRLRLFCFPYAGGSAAVFRDWQNYLPPTIQVCPVEFPGRGSRLMETPFEDITSLVEAMVPGIQPLLKVPFAFFGHSLGALVSFELSCFLRQKYNKVPVHLFVSGRQAPPIPDPSPMHALSEANLVSELHRLGGTPKAVLESSEVIQLLLPMVRADLKIDEIYDYKTSEPFDFPITVFGGLDDPETTKEGLGAWKEHTIGKFSLQIFPGNHFFINTAQKLVLDSIGTALSTCNLKN